jgi:ABC-2 type transport system permease protein
MAVYKRTYAGHEGPTTPAWSRFLILGRYNYARLSRQRFLILLIVVSLFYPIGCLVYVYLSANPGFLAALGIPAFEVDGEFFYRFCWSQGMLAFLLTAFVSPSLISWDLANGALPLYFCRPFSRAEYVLGKLSVMLPLLSMITWIPAVILFSIKAGINGWSWFADYWWLGRGVFLGLLLWSVLLSLIGLATSAYVRWRVAAGALILGIVFGGAGLAAAVNSVMNVQAGSMLSLTQVLLTICSDLLRYDMESDITAGNAWMIVALITFVCLWLLHRRIRTFQVIR